MPVDSPICQLPMLAFPILTTSIKPKTPEAAKDLLLWHRISGMRGASALQLISEMCTTTTLRSMLYIHDTFHAKNS